MVENEIIVIGWQNFFRIGIALGLGAAVGVGVAITMLQIISAAVDAAKMVWRSIRRAK